MTATQLAQLCALLSEFHKTYGGTSIEETFDTPWGMGCQMMGVIGFYDAVNEAQRKLREGTPVDGTTNT